MISSSVVMCRKIRKKPTLPGIYWSGNNRWHLYSGPLQDTILDALINNSAFASLGIIKSREHPLGAEYLVDVKNLQQINAESGIRRSILLLPQTQHMVHLFSSADAYLPLCFLALTNFLYSSTKAQGIT